MQLVKERSCRNPNPRTGVLINGNLCECPTWAFKTHQRNRALLVWTSEDIQRQLASLVSIASPQRTPSHGDSQNQPHSSANAINRACTSLAENLGPRYSPGHQDTLIVPVKTSVRYCGVWNHAGCLGRTCKGGCMVFLLLWVLLQNSFGYGCFSDGARC